MSANLQLNVTGDVGESTVAGINRAIESEFGGDGRYDRLQPWPVRWPQLVSDADRDDPVGGWRYRGDLLVVSSTLRAYSPTARSQALHLARIVRDRLPATATLYWSSDERDDIGDVVTDELLDQLQNGAGGQPQ